MGNHAGMPENEQRKLSPPNDAGRLSPKVQTAMRNALRTASACSYLASRGKLTLAASSRRKRRETAANPRSHLSLDRPVSVAPSIYICGSPPLCRTTRPAAFDRERGEQAAGAFTRRPSASSRSPLLLGPSTLTTWLSHAVDD
jgi:hypothetical protein